MKIIITTIICIFFFLFANGQSPLQKRLDFSINNVPLQTALEQLSQTSDVNIAFSSNFFNEKNRISIDAKNETLEFILQQLLKDANLTFMPSGNQIILLRTKKIKPTFFTLSGYLEDKDSGERLIGAHVYSYEHKKGTASNEYGFYSLTLPKGTTKINFSYLGAKEIIESIDLVKDLHKDFSLETSIKLSEIIVSSLTNIKNNNAHTIDKNNSNVETLEEFKSMPVNDPMQQIQLLAGVEAGMDRFGGLYVRGGNQDQNLLLMDGVPIYNPSHMLGLFSIYNKNTVRKAKFYKSGFPARFGGRLSSVFDVRTKDGNLKNFEGEYSTNVFSSSATIEGPIKKDVSSFFISARRSQLDYIIKALLNSDDDEINSDVFAQRFYDFNAKLNFKLSTKDKLHLSFYSGDDLFGLEFEPEAFDRDFEESFANVDLSTNWGNKIFALRWNHLTNSKLFSNTTFTYSKYDFRLNNLQDIDNFNGGERDTSEYFFNEYETRVTEVALKTDYDYVHSPKHYFRFGAGVLIHNFEQEIYNFSEAYAINDTLDINPEIEDFFNEEELTKESNSIEVNAYFEDDIKWSDKFTTNLGIRLSVYNADENITSILEPRLIGKYSLNNNLLLQASYTRNSQYLHLLSSGISLPTDVWLPSINELKPQIGQQGTLGLFYTNKNKFHFQVEGFYKTMQNVIQNQSSIFNEEITEFTISDSTFIIGDGKAYGVEFSMSKKYNKSFAFFNYTLSKSERTYAELNNGEPFPFLYDRRHSIRLGINWQLTRKLDLSSSWTFYTGAPKIILDQLFSSDSEIIDKFNPPNNYNSSRTKDFHRLDTSFRFTFPRKKTTHLLKLGGFNIYGKKNETLHVIEYEDKNGVEKSKLTPLSLFTFMPQIVYTVKFDYSKKK